MELTEFRPAVDAWLDDHAAELAPPYEGHGTLDDQLARLAEVKRLAYDAGWMRWGWPQHVGGLGGVAPGRPARSPRTRWPAARS
jgi:alkylation response protein AidB-like acyl-CoA dehydrogenase